MSKKNTNSNNTNTSPAATAGNKDMFCKLLRHYRQKKNLSQRELGLMLGLSRSGYANYENGACLPCIDQINLLSEILDYDFLFAFTRANASIASYERKKSLRCLYATTQEIIITIHDFREKLKIYNPPKP